MSQDCRRVHSLHSPHEHYAPIFPRDDTAGPQDDAADPLCDPWLYIHCYAIIRCDFFILCFELPECRTS